MTLREGRWDCPSCGARGVLGRNVSCPSCARPRPEGVAFYLPGDEPEVTDAALLAQAQAGPDWVCRHCGGSNRDGTDDCAGCGAPRGDSRTQRVGGEMASPAEPDRAPPPSPSRSARPLSGNRSSGTRVGRNVVKGCGCGCGGLLLLLIVALVLAAMDSVGGEDLRAATVASRTWTRSVSVEKLEVTPHEGWDAPPAGALEVRQEKRVHHQDSVVDHYHTVTHDVVSFRRVDDGSETRTRSVSAKVRTGTRRYVCGHRSRGNGYFEDVECSEPVYETQTHTETYEEPRYHSEPYYRTVTESLPVYRFVPVYATWYRYRIRAWRPLPVVTASSDVGPPEWPARHLSADERQVATSEKRIVTFRGPDAPREPLEMDSARWMSLPPGRRVALRNVPIFASVDAAKLVVLPPDSLAACRKWHLGRGKPPSDSLGCSPRTSAPTGK